MKKSIFVFSSLALAAVLSAHAQFTSQQPAAQVNTVTDTSVVIKNGKAGTATIETTGLKMVALNDTAPAGMKVEASLPDTSGQGTANIASFADNPALAANKLCWHGVGPVGWHQKSCAAVSVNGTAKHGLSVPTTMRGEVLALVPVLEDASGKMITFVSHPAQVRKQLHCGDQKQQASLFYVDKNGAFRPATDDEAAAYDRDQYPKICKASA